MSLLQLKSFEQITGSMITTVLAQLGLNDINPGSTILTLLEAAATEDFEQYVQMVNIIRGYNLDTTIGADLDNRAFEFGLTRLQPISATGFITIERAASFTEVSTNFYAGLPSPVSGGSVIYVNNASSPLFGSSGSLILGRGTSNEEVVTYTTPPINNTYYWTINISPLANNHLFSESVILSQGGNVLIPGGTIVQVPAAGTSPAILFTVNTDTTLLDGAQNVTNVIVTCQTPGIIGNIPVAAINGTSAFTSPPFPGAQATNPSAFTTGQNLESDDSLRSRIKNTIQSLSKGTETAILNGIIGLTDPVSAQSVVSASIILPTTETEDVQVYIDNGIGLEPTFNQQGFETVLSSAIGGESRFQLQFAPLVQAQLITLSSQPFNMSSGTLSLDFTVGANSGSITFQPSDFVFPTAVTSTEIVNVINAQSTLINASTTDSGNNVVITSTAQTNEQIQVTGGAANSILNFPINKIYTLNLYKNDILLSKDGSTAVITCTSNGPYNFSSLSFPWVLNVIIDNKSANPQTVTFNNVNLPNPSAAQAQDVVNVINAQLAGATASVTSTNNSLQISSNTLLSSNSAIQVTGGNVNTLLNFPLSVIQGTNSDYTLNRFIGQLELNSPLSPNDSLTAGSLFTRAQLIASTPETYSVLSGQDLVIVVDGGTPQTITFASALSGVTAASVANYINTFLVGATASSRTIGSLNYLEIASNSQIGSVGSIEILSSSTATGFGFATNTLILNELPTAAFVVSANPGPYNFAENEQLVIIFDNQPSTNISTTLFNYKTTVLSSASSSSITVSNLNITFPSSTLLPGFFVIADSGINTYTAMATSVAGSGNTWVYTVSTLPVSPSFISGDHVIFSGMQNSVNNGSFLIQNITNSFPYQVTVTNEFGTPESSSTGSALLGQRRQINTYNSVTNTITVSNPFYSAFSSGDNISLLPSTTQNVVNYLNNLKITQALTLGSIQIATQAGASLSNISNYIQISSNQAGSNGYVQVAGGTANVQLGFATNQFQGLAAYEYYTGLIQLVNTTIYGSDSNPATYPGIGAAGIQFNVQAPTINEVEFNILLTLAAGVTISSVSDQVYSAITGYVNSLPIGQSVILADIISAVIQVQGVVDVSIISPTSNVLINQNELAKTSNSLITFG